MPDLATVEREKYRRMWSVDEYRRNSPGLNILPRALELLDPPAGATFTDFGSGPEGLVVQRLDQLGYTATGIDFVSEHPDVTEGCLWSMPTSPPSDYGLCFDVLEHIPTDKLPAVLDRLRLRSGTGIALTVATIECSVGNRHGETLHETVQPIEWWNEMIGEHVGPFTRHDTDRDWRSLYIVQPWHR